MKKILGMGAALVDVLSFVDDAWVKASGSEKGGMTLIDEKQSQEWLAQVKNPVLVPGGSACNTIVGLSRLGARTAFIAKIGHDELGKRFETHLSDAHVESKLLYSEKPTGSVLAAVTPDAQRTMFTYLGASDDLDVDDIQDSLFQDNVSVFYIEGYRAYNGPCFKKALQLAKKNGVTTVVDFGAFSVVKDCRALFDNLFEEKLIDIIIANEDEAFAYTGKKEEEALAVLASKSSIAVVKLGKRGALISKEGIVTSVDAEQVNAIDTTGAGDLWAAGFLFAYLEGEPLSVCGRLASLVASEVVQVMGPQIPEEGWFRIRRFFR